MPWWAGIILFIAGIFIGIMIVALLDANNDP